MTISQPLGKLRSAPRELFGHPRGLAFSLGVSYLPGGRASVAVFDEPPPSAEPTAQAAPPPQPRPSAPARAGDEL